MQTKRRIEITIETERVLLIRRRQKPVLAWCEQCGQQVELVTLEEAIALARASSRTIHRWVEGGRLHFTETPAGAVLICASSLALTVS